MKMDEAGVLTSKVRENISQAKPQQQDTSPYIETTNCAQEAQSDLFKGFTFTH